MEAPVGLKPVQGDYEKLIDVRGYKRLWFKNKYLKSERESSRDKSDK